jgi:Gas vesicle protein G
MVIVDRMLVGGIKFVLDKVAQAVDAELHDDAALREQLLSAQMRLELGELTEAEFAAIERDLLARIREMKERRTGGEAISPLDAKVTGVEARFGGDDDNDR